MPGPNGLRRLLVLRALGLGDLLTVFPALRALRRAEPTAEIVLATPARLAPLALASGAVDRVVPASDLATDLTETGIAVAVNLHGRGPQSARLLDRTRPRRLLSYRHADVASTLRGPRWHEDEHEVRRWCRMLAWYGVDADETALELDTSRLARANARDMNMTIVHPGAADAARRWPPERFAAIAGAQQRRARTVVVTGSRDEGDLARFVVERAGLPSRANVSGCLDLVELASLVSSAGAVVCGDTGIAHLATATSTPSVVLFGPTSPARWGPPPRDRHRVLWAGQLGDPHGTTPSAGLLAIGVEQVLDELAVLQSGTDS
jgi:ADP-heptose:LPS heptosyltransferase